MAARHRPRRHRAVHGREHPRRARDRARRRPHAAVAELVRQCPADRLHRGVPLHAAARPDHLVLLRVPGPRRARHPGRRRRFLVLSLYTGAFYAEIFRGGVLSIERGQWDAARAIGMRRRQVLRTVILPQAIKRMIPPFMNQSIIQLKNTSLVSTIAVSDLLYQGTLITSATYRPLETYTTVAVIYFAVLFPLTLAAQAVERRLQRSD